MRPTPPAETVTRKVVVRMTELVKVRPVRVFTVVLLKPKTITAARRTGGRKYDDMRNKCHRYLKPGDR